MIKYVDPKKVGVKTGKTFKVCWEDGPYRMKIQYFETDSEDEAKEHVLEEYGARMSSSSYPYLRCMVARKPYPGEESFGNTWETLRFP